MSEATITINGKTLTEAQSLTVRVALTSYYAEMKVPNALGADDVGREIAANYHERCCEVLAIIIKGNT